MLLTKAFQSKHRLFLHSSNIYKLLYANNECKYATTTTTSTTTTTTTITTATITTTNHSNISKASSKEFPPVPSLEHTLKRYLEYVSVIVNNDQAKLSHTEKAIAEFRNVGKRLHEKLEKIADEQDNWINQFWLPEMYLKVRLPLPTNSNPAYIFPQQKFNNLDEQLSYTAWIVRGFCDYKDLIDR
ncbi:Choline O-acetyltransferase [Dirofilaria immitis]|nr:Choline O-acetyltransferase [Dirofilaria immitis]